MGNPNESVVDKHNRLEKEIENGQERLRRLEPNSPLLRMASVDSCGINYDFGGIEGAKYANGTRTLGEAIDLYVKDLNRAVAAAEQRAQPA